MSERATASMPAAGSSAEPSPVASLATVRLRRGKAQRPPPAFLGNEAAAAAHDLAAAVPVSGDPVAILAWWERLKRGRLLPLPADLDRAAVGAAWSEAMLLELDAAAARVVRAMRLSNGDVVPSELIEYSTLVTEWLLAVGRRAAQRAGALVETHSFPAGFGVAVYRLVALPFGNPANGVEQVLCRLGPG